MPASLGPTSIPPALLLLEDELIDIAQRLSAVDELTAIARQYPETRTTVIAALERVLGGYEELPPELVTRLVQSLTALGAAEAMPTIQRAFESGRVDELQVPWEVVMVELAMLPPGIVPGYDAVKADMTALEKEAKRREQAERAAEKQARAKKKAERQARKKQRKA